ncbi:MAG TPA: hypothetical protein VNH18_01430 [Bryobacteraceae bacterium]|nr:hypothetical protein [Bryobacteraceae bacterium]
MRIVIGMAILALLLTAGSWKISRRSSPPHRAPAAAGCLTAQEKKSLPHWIAIRAMPLNWLVRTADLAAPQTGSPPPVSALTGKFVACKIVAGDSLIVADLAAAPRIPLKKGKLLVPLPLSNGDADALNAGESIGLFDGTTEVIGNAEVAALDCRAACVAWLQVTGPERQLLDQKKSSAFRLVSRSGTESKETP